MLNMGTDTTLLRMLLRQRHLKYETFCVEYEKIAQRIAPGDIAPSKAQYYRWLSGHLKGGMPYPDACRVLEAMFPPWTVTDLLGPYMPDRHFMESGNQVSSADLLETVPSSFTAGTLQGSWVTCYEFSQPPKHHADIAHLSA